MDFQDLDSTHEVWITDSNLAIKAARAQKCRIEDLRAVRSGHNNDGCAGIRLETIKFFQQLVERLLTFVVAPQAHDSPAALADGVNLIDEHDRRSLFARLFE
jgi:hypothetical protein